jgi:N-acyl homoserine lactone hydrolase
MGLRVVPLECGWLGSDLSGLLEGGDGRVRLPIPSWLVLHPRGTLVFDTGLHRQLQSDTSRIGSLERVFAVDFAPGQELSARLEQAGVDPAAVDLAVFSHLHFDHCGGTELVPEARLVVQRSEWEAAHHPKLIAHDVYNPDDFDLGHDVQLVDGEHDVFGDGSVVCLPTPGHTVGHQSLRVGLDSGPVVLTGDCVYFRRQLDEMRTPPFGADLDQQRASMRGLARLERDGCRLLFGHDAEQWATLPAEGLT